MRMTSLQVRAYKVVPGRYYGTPKELWGFRLRPGRGSPVSIARAFVRANAALLGVEGIGRRLRLARVIESLGARHVLFQQHHEGLRIHRAYVTVHMDHERCIYLAKNRAVPADLLPARPRYKITVAAAIRRAIRAIGAAVGGVSILGTERLWFPVAARLRPAIRVRVHRHLPREEWIVHVDGRTGRILSKYDNLALSVGRARIFDPNPVVALGDWKPLLRRGRPIQPPAAAYRETRLSSLTGTGYLDGRRVSTWPTRGRIRRSDHRFLFESTEPGFEETMVYVHLDRAMRYLESLGYRGRRAIFTAPLAADARGTRDDNSWYSPGLRRLTFGVGGVDDAEDAEIILHEFGHALQDAICPDFGQSPEAAAMGEGFGDYLAASFFADRKPWHLRATVGSWDAIADGGDPPCMRRVDEPLTFESFDHSPDADEHENGKIWAAALWEIRQVVGREVADAVIIESHFQLDGFTRFARGARAILDADRNLYGGRHLADLRRVFTTRGIGPIG
jgi:hypothetical protein